MNLFPLRLPAFPLHLFSVRRGILFPLLLTAACGSEPGDPEGDPSPAGTAGATAALSCPADVDLDSDPDHCGACDRACAIDQICLGGECFRDCESSGRTSCGDDCVDTRFDPAHCGSCGNVCTEGVCDAGKCKAACDSAGRVACDGRCVDPESDPEACGGCGAACRDGSVCLLGSCRASCGADRPNECGNACVDLRTDPSHCGACGVTCASGQVCVAGACADECSGSRPVECDDRCVDPLTDPRHCGACGNVCAPGDVCSGGECASDCTGSDEARCDSSCVNLHSDPLNCGACGLACRPGAVCSEGLCAADCRGAAETRCGDACTNLDQDVRHCGACDRACDSGQFCSGADCVAECPEDAPVECGRTCRSEDAVEECLPACSGSTPDRCGTGCFDLATDEAHCGACGDPCKAGESCIDGDCTPPCVDGEVVCDGACVDLSSDEAHCGTCETACDENLTCKAHSCVTTVDRIVSSSAAACALSSDDRIFCWGRHFGQFGAGLPVEIGPFGVRQVASAWVPGLTGDLVDLGLGQYNGCAVDAQGGVRCWGQPSGILGVDPAPLVDQQPATTLVGWPELRGPIALTTSTQGSACAITAAGTLVCWGNGARGMTVPTDYWMWSEVPGLSNLVAVRAGPGMMCAREEDGTLHCFGVGYLTPAGNQSSVTPVEVTELPPLTAPVDLEASVAVGDIHVCAVVGDGDVMCWGGDSYGQLGGPGTDPQPITVPGLPLPARAVQAANYASCAILSNGSLWCWGRILNVGSEVITPHEVIPGGVTRVAMSQDLVFAQLESGEVLSWGGEGECLGRPAFFEATPLPCCEFPD